MGIQTVIDRAETITVLKKKLNGSTISRSGRIRTAQVASAQPFRFTVEYAPMQQYTPLRGVLEELDRLDTIFTEAIDIGSTNAGLSWITGYQGDLTPAQLGQISVVSASAQTITLSTQNVTGSSATDYLVKAGDYIQFDSGYKYPYCVTQDVQIGATGGSGTDGTEVSISVHRPILSQDSYTIAGKGILVGNDVTWQVKMLSKPNYTVLPSRYVEFTGSFELMELIED